ncbi:hypothetical protein [Bacteroides congonensis]|jgi:ferredoxin
MSDIAINTLLLEILHHQNGGTFCNFSNADGKRWIMPIKNMCTAMHLYQPSSLKGKIMRIGFPYLHRFKLVRKILHVEREYWALDKQLSDILCDVFNRNDLEFSIFLGTPSVHQKITIQLNCGKQICGYCKVTASPEIKELFHHEERILNELHQQGIDDVPRCLYCGALKGDVDLFVQTTVKSNNSIVDHEWGKRQEDFIKNLYEKTWQTLVFEQTDFYNDLCFLNGHLLDLEKWDRQAVETGIRKVMSTYEGKEVNFSVYHADFTPWNMFVEKGRLFVFDFEYAKETYPAYLDYFHFFMQTSIFEKHRGVMEIWSEFEHNIPILKHKFVDVRLAFLCYLLAVLAQYVRRDNGGFTGDVLRNMKIWIALITRL